jgi:hypothetical protein
VMPFHVGCVRRQGSVMSTGHAVTFLTGRNRDFSNGHRQLSGREDAPGTRGCGSNPQRDHKICGDCGLPIRRSTLAENHSAMSLYLETRMSDPVTIGTLAASVLAMAAEAVVKSGVGEVVKDAYKALKEKVAIWARGDIEALAKTPTSTSRQVVIAEEIDRQSPEDQADIQKLAIALNDALRNAARAGPIGIDIGRLEAARVQLAAINVTEGVGFRADEVKTTGDFTTGPIIVGKTER